MRHILYHVYFWSLYEARSQSQFEDRMEVFLEWIRPSTVLKDLGWTVHTQAPTRGGGAKKTEENVRVFLKQPEFFFLLLGSIGKYLNDWNNKTSCEANSTLITASLGGK